MALIVVREPGTVVSVDQTHYTLRRKGKKVGRIPPLLMEQLVVYDGVQITPKAMDRLTSHGVIVTFLTDDGRVRARLAPLWRPDPRPRVYQIRAYLDEGQRLELAKRLIDAKLANSAEVLRIYASNYKDPALREARKELVKVRSQIPTVSSLASLLGLEGTAARIYFGVFGRMFRVSWTTFSGRKRQPPPDPVNALLSYGYAVIYRQILAFLEAVGLDPYVGYLHEMERGRASLALDLMEPLRSVIVDRMVLRLLNRNILQEKHFTRIPEQNAVQINWEGRERILRELVDWINEVDEFLGEEELTSPLWIMKQAVEELLKACQKEDWGLWIPYYLRKEDRWKAMDWYQRA